jgi:hypothetical protein
MSRDDQMLQLKPSSGPIIETPRPRRKLIEKFQNVFYGAAAGFGFSSRTGARVPGTD